MSFFVYIHTCPNGKKYVGVTRRTPEERWGEGKGYRNNKHFTSAINKYGWDNIEHEYFKTESKDLMFYWEKILIYYHNTLNREFGYNKTSGGDSCFEFSEETKRKISEAGKGRKLSDDHRIKLITVNEARKGVFKHSEETKNKISNSAKGRVAWNKGRQMPPRSEEYRRKISEANRKRKYSEETKRKISEANKGRKMTEEQKMNISNAQKGRTHSEETKRKMSEARKLYWENKRKNNT